MLKTGTFGRPGAIMYAFDPSGERNICFAVKLPCPRLNDVSVLPTVGVHPVGPAPVSTAIRSMFGGFSATICEPLGSDCMRVGVPIVVTSPPAGALSHVRRTETVDGPAMYANAPSLRNAIEFPVKPRSSVCSELTRE